MNINYLILTAILLGSCKSTTNTHEAKLSTTPIPIREHSVQSVLWQQQSAEYKALCYQAFNVAKMQLNQTLQQITMDNRPMAIITDIDETVLDNSPYNAMMIREDKAYTKQDWINWGLLKNAKAVPGALEFFNYASSKGIEIFYISNRYAIQNKETQENLKTLGFPNVDDQHTLLKTTTSGKEERRNSVAKSHKIVMLLGDNLSDFDDVFDNQPTAKRNQLAEELNHKFGTEFIVLPNPMYGDWETKGIYEGRYDWSPTQQDSIRKSKLIAY